MPELASAWPLSGIVFGKHSYPDDYWRFTQKDFKYILNGSNGRSLETNMILLVGLVWV